MRKVIQKVDKIICVSRFELEHFQRLLNSPRKKFEIIPNGVNLNKFREKDCPKANPPILLLAGRLEKYKGHHRVLRAFKLFQELYPEVKLKLYILGKKRMKLHF
jgi:glycosyltransferase involved in cell wall biosynthesis